MSSQRYRKLEVKLSSRDRRNLRNMLDHGHGSARVFRRSIILLLLHSGESSEQIGKTVGATPKTVRNIGWKYIQGGLKEALYERPRPGKKTSIDSHQEKEIIALACSSPPGERSRWTLELLREQVKAMKIIEEIGRETLRTLLQDCQVKPWLEKNVVRGHSHGRIHHENGGHP